MNDDKSEISSNGKSSAQVPANCTVCNMQFSNRANARRHEKNIHHKNLLPSNVSCTIQQTTNSTNSTPNNGMKPVTTNTITNQSSGTSVMPMKKKVSTQIEIDYTKPELYRHLLTPTKLTFILNNLNFLEQAQDMTCKCCNKTFPSYKFFMGHMRKKYHGLPRNVCFRCLKQFDSKGQFIGHLKRPGGTCPNLYRLVMADDSIPKDLIPTDTNLRIPAKDVLNNRVYACAICDDTFRLKSDFREHVYGVHLEVTKNRETPNASCINCNEAFTDSSVRRKHFNNLDCIVYIVCNTCGEQFSTQSIYLEHVYQTHLSAKEMDQPEEVILFEEPPEEQMPQSTIISPSNKNIQKCPVCNKQYNNYYNVLRHMEAKHPDQVPQTYQCPECPNEKFSKQTYLRDHLIKVHNKVDVSPKQLVQHQIGNNNIINNNNNQHLLQQHQNNGVQKLPAYVCKASNCGAEFREKSKWLDHQMEEHSGQYWCMFCTHIDTEREAFEKHLEMIHQNNVNNNSSSSVSINLTNGNDSDNENNDTKQNLSVDATNSFKCRMCAKRIATKTGLQKHMIKVHNVGGELVKCTLCPADFANDKGLKVHLWRCHEIREADYENVLPPDLLDPYTQQQRKLKQEEEQKSIVMANETGQLASSRTSYECPFCHIVYHSKDELIDHSKAVHAVDDPDILDPDDFMQQDFSESEETKLQIDESAVMQDESAEYWFQCRFCDRSFNSSKKLTIHMNSHQMMTNGPDENGGYPCKECNVVYKSKKSLWVHRHKKHPKHPVPSPCDSCEKVFFDRNELMFHMQHAHPGSIPLINDSQKENENESNMSESLFTEGHWLLDSSTETSQIMKPPTAHLSDQNADRVPKKRKRPAASETPDGQYACDMCVKCFSNANALQVHRGWHFRSPDGRKVKDPSQMWHPDQVPPSKVRRTGPTTSSAMPNAISPMPTAPICPHCNQKFASHNNLRRHIVEVHKSRESSSINDADVKVDRVGECTRCNLTFSTLAEWVDHKINDAKNRKSLAAGQQSGYEWNCEICLKPFTRRERLMQHMLSHLNDRQIDQTVLNEHRAKMNANNSSVNENGVKISNEQKQPQQQQKVAEQIKVQQKIQQHHSSSEEDSDAENSDNDEQEQKASNSFSCGLCSVVFTSSQELRAHVSEHFLNGSGGMTAPTTTNTTSASTPASKSMEESDDEEETEDENDDELDIDDDVKNELANVQFEEAEVDYENHPTNHEESQDGENSDGHESEDEESVLSAEEEEEDEVLSAEEEEEDEEEIDDEIIEKPPQQNEKPQLPIARLQVQLHRCRVCNAAFVEQYKSVECMVSHQNRITSHKCNECQLYFKDAKQLEDHENLCHSD
jgi:hypothetical protein